MGRSKKHKSKVHFVTAKPKANAKWFKAEEKTDD